MGIVDKIKGAFKKKDKDASATVKKGKESCGCGCGCRAAKFSGSGEVAHALKFAAEKIDAKVEAGKLKDARADAFVGQLKAVEASDAAEDAKLVQISQIIGAINDA